MKVSDEVVGHQICVKRKELYAEFTIVPLYNNKKAFKNMFVHST